MTVLSDRHRAVVPICLQLKGACESPRGEGTMIVSHEYKFIFIRTEKTAGTSLSAALKPFLGRADLVGKLTRPAWAKYSPIHHGALMRHFPQLFGLHTHATAAQVRAVVGPEVFSRYFKFCVERNPWDRQVSLYFHRKRKRNELESANFDKDMRSIVYRCTEYTRLRNWEIYTIKNKIAVDHVIRYENINEELPRIFSHLGLPASIELPWRRSGNRDPNLDYRRYYSEWTRDLVARWYRREIEQFGYKF